MFLAPVGSMEISWLRNPEHRWWVEDSVGPLDVGDVMCESCGDYLVACTVHMDWQGTFMIVQFCHVCTAAMLLQHNRVTTIWDLYWT